MSRIRTLDIDELNERLRELIDARDNHVIDTDDDTPEGAADVAAAWAEENPDEAAELAKLEALRDEIGSDGDLISTDGGPFVDELDFADYAQELAEETAPSREVRQAMDSWPYRHIDWEAAAKELAYDYSSVEWAGSTYLYRP